MNGPPPQVSVVMPAFNAARYVPEAIESVLSQTLTDFEFIIVNDGSTDRTAAILSEYCKRDQRIKVLSRPNRGIAASRNDGLEAARAELIASMDSDDVALPNRLEIQVAFLKKHPRVVCVGGAGELIDEKGRYLTTMRLPTSHDEITKAALAGHTPIWGPAATFRRERAKKVGGFSREVESAEDLDLWLKLGEIGLLANLPEAVVRYRLHPESVSETRGQFQLAAMARACRDAWQRRGIEGTFEAVELHRPGPSAEARYRFALKCGWWAFNSGERRTALIYGLKAVASKPLVLLGWTLVACAVMKRRPRAV